MEFVKEMIKLIFFTVNILIIIYALYYVVTGLFVFLSRKNKIRKYKAKNKIAVVIAARNEANIIGNLINSLKKQNYPKDMYEIFVVPNNCTDNTKEVSMLNGAQIIDCNIPVNSKGDVLKLAFDYLRNNLSEYDAYCVFDADNIVHPEFLRRMNDTLCAGYNVAQGYRDSKNPHDTWISSCYSLYYWIQNFFFNKARMNMGWSASINGTGFMVAKSVIDKNGFNTVTVTEDIEFAALCALNNERIAFVSDAITYDEQPLTFKESWKQRKRWTNGTYQCLSHYSLKLMKTGIRKKIPQCIDMGLFFLAPLVQVLTCVCVIFFLAYDFLGLEIFNIVDIMCNKNVLSLIMGYVISLFLAIFILFIEKKSILKTLKGIFTFAIFMVTWVPINIICMVQKKYTWEPTEHKVNVDIDSIMKD